MPKYCTNILRTGTCTSADCQKRHDIHKCTCGTVLPKKYLDSHLRGTSHIRLVNSIARPPIPVPVKSKVIAPTQPRSARNPSQHDRRERVAQVETALLRGEADKNGISVSHQAGIEFGVINHKDIRKSLQRFIEVKVDDDALGRIGLNSMCFASSVRQQTHATNYFFATLMGSTRWVQQIYPRSIAITFRPVHEGRYEDILELTFHDIKTMQVFTITRRVSGTVGSPEDHEKLKPAAPFRKTESKRPSAPTRIVSVSRPPTWSESIWKIRLPQSKTPKDIIDAAFGPRPHDEIKGFFPPNLDAKTYARRFQVLLWIEAEQMQRNLDLYSVENVPLEPNYPRYKLKVENLAEGRYSILVGDIILVRKREDKSGTWYEGCVHEVHGAYIEFRFSDEFNVYRGNKVDVRFILNRVPERRMHQAVTASFSLSRLLFPSDHTPGVLYTQPPTEADIDKIHLVNRKLTGNREQLQAIAAIVNRPPGSIPFVVFGPPGTGKTVTLIEAIQQILIRDPDARVLACAPSNSAADLIAMGLINIGPTDLLRLNSYARPYKQLAATLREYCLVNKHNVFENPSLQHLQSFRVVVSTAVCAAVPYGLGAKRGHFTHIFIDEAGQASEPMSMIPIKLLANTATNVVLAGDVKQLNAVVFSGLAASLGLKHSYLERMMALNVYDTQHYSGRNVVKLLKNFRSHPAILDFPNHNFYQGELQPCADPVLSHSMLRSDQLVTADFPVVFHGIAGKDEREASSPSFFNIDEATIVKNICLALVQDRRLRLEPSRDIGVIAPYHAQCGKIMSILPTKLRGIKVGSVEEFQGQERRVIIISTVRSSTDFVPYDLRHALGFVADTRRFNVAITRAQALLIVVGNPAVLGLDPMWKSFLNYIALHGGWRGKKMDWDPQERLHDEHDEDRQRAMTDADNMIQRIRSQVLERIEDWAIPNYDENVDGGANEQGFFDQPWNRDAD